MKCSVDFFFYNWHLYCWMSKYRMCTSLFFKFERKPPKMCDQRFSLSRYTAHLSKIIIIAMEITTQQLKALKENNNYIISDSDLVSWGMYMYTQNLHIVLLCPIEKKRRLLCVGAFWCDQKVLSCKCDPGVFGSTFCVWIMYLDTLYSGKWY